MGSNLIYAKQFYLHAKFIPYSLESIKKCKQAQSDG